MLTFAALSIFGLIPLVPIITRLARNTAGWVLAILPLVLAGYFVSRIDRIRDNDAVLESISWVPTLGINLSFRLDGLSLIFALLITGIGALVVIYAGEYLKGHRYLARFYTYLLLFMGAMLGLVLADNIFTLFIFWELTSISSYLLIGFNHEEDTSQRSALQALVVTGMGGLALLAGLVILGQTAGSTELSEILTRGELIRSDDLYVPMLLLVLAGAFTKSAQFPFHFWLPNAMVAPTPVSAYLHSATMVKAGIYLLMRLSPVLGGTDTWLYFVTIAGGVTMVMGAFVALIETDFKRILAYSTLSVLGLLTMMLGEGSDEAVKAAVAFLIAHALYKGALFLVAGAVDHETEERDVRRLGGLIGKMPVTGAAALLAGASFAGLIPTFAFIAKETVFEAVIHSDHASVLLTFTATIAAAFLVGAAGVVSIGPFLGRLKETPLTPHEAPIGLWLGPAVLATGGIVLGVLPGGITGDIVGPAAQQIAGAPIDVDIALWHGLNAPLLLSAVSIGIGICVFVSIGRIRAWSGSLDRASGLTAERWYYRALATLIGAAAALTRIQQDGYLRHYVLTIIAVSAALTGYTLVTRASAGGLEGWGDIRLHEGAVAALIVFGAIAAVLARSRLAAVASLGIVGYGIALVYMFFGAPDLAMTQVLVETLTVLLFVLVLYHLPREVRFSSTLSRARDAIVAIGVGALVTSLILVANSSSSQPSISDYFAERSKAEAFGANVVNVILVDFRALDTLGEITVLTLAGAGVFALLKLRPRKEERE